MTTAGLLVKLLENMKRIKKMPTVFGGLSLKDQTIVDREVNRSSLVRKLLNLGVLYHEIAKWLWKCLQAFW